MRRCGCSSRKGLRLALSLRASSSPMITASLRAGGIGTLHLRLEAAAAAVEDHVEAGAAQAFGGAEGRRLCQFSPGARHTRRARHAPPARLVAVLFLQQRDQALDAHGETAGRRRLAAELLDQAVVAAAGADRALGAQLVGDPLEHGQVVVVEAAHQARVDAIRHAGFLEQRLHPGEMLQRGLAEEIHQLRRPSTSSCMCGILAVEDAQRIGMQAALGVGIERLAMALEIGDQLGAVATALLGILPRELISSRMPVSASSSHSRAHITICSASTSGPG
jgi:hypothetical protein